MGQTTYPWGGFYPPNWDDGSYAVAEDGKLDPACVGVDGVKGTAPVGSFKMNVLGFYDLGGNVTEWMWDGLDERTSKRVRRGADWIDFGENCAVATRYSINPVNRYNRGGFRVALSSVP